MRTVAAVSPAGSLCRQGWSAVTYAMEAINPSRARLDVPALRVAKQSADFA
jgi:hypothetical protein